ncbi:MAG: site-specific integrase, partial [Bacteroidota bacterium]
RRSELVALKVDDIEFCEQGMLIHIRKSKTDQAGKGKTHDVHFGSHEKTCPVKAVQDWLVESEIREGAVFRRIDRHGNLGDNPIHGDSISRIIKKYAVMAGLDHEKYSSHSLRRGGITTSLRNGVRIEVTKGRSTHADMDTFLQYVEEAKRFQVNVTVAMGL